jgi:hypothetical protein
MYDLRNWCLGTMTRKPTYTYVHMYFEMRCWSWNSVRAERQIVDAGLIKQRVCELAIRNYESKVVSLSKLFVVIFETALLL